MRSVADLETRSLLNNHRNREWFVTVKKLGKSKFRSATLFILAVTSHNHWYWPVTKLDLHRKPPVKAPQLRQGTVVDKRTMMIVAHHAVVAVSAMWRTWRSNNGACISRPAGKIWKTDSCRLIWIYACAALACLERYTAILFVCICMCDWDPGKNFHVFLCKFIPIHLLVWFACCLIGIVKRLRLAVQHSIINQRISGTHGHFTDQGASIIFYNIDELCLIISVKTSGKTNVFFIFSPWSTLGSLLPGFYKGGNLLFVALPKYQYRRLATAGHSRAPLGEIGARWAQKKRWGFKLPPRWPQQYPTIGVSCGWWIIFCIEGSPLGLGVQ